MTRLRTTITAGILALAGSSIGLVAGSGQAAAAVPACGNSSLDYGVTRTDGFAGHSAFVLLYRNHTGAHCTLYGYPGLDAMASNGFVIAHARRTLLGSAGGSRKGVQLIDIPPGGYASATVEWANFNPATSGPCRYSAGVTETAPNTTRVVALRRSVSICSLQVHPTVRGWTGQS
ncbi:MAG: DUF4232 domain-containing protein [Actinobacteria bacterium]|nr:DUF4232 domain-containing protein [Actinomycetota bacterium]